jgi:hypothetical protein
VIRVVVTPSRIVRVVLEVEPDRVPLPVLIWGRQVDTYHPHRQIGGQVNTQAAELHPEAPAHRGRSTPLVEHAQLEHRFDEVGDAVDVDVGRVREGGGVDVLLQRDRCRGLDEAERLDRRQGEVLFERLAVRQE